MNTLTEQAIKTKFADLLGEAQIMRGGGIPPNQNVRWIIQVTNLIERVCGRESAHYDAIKRQLPESYSVDEVVGIVEAAQADYADGFLAEIRYLVRADLLDDFLTQAEALQHNGYYVPAASLAGAVLEDTLRKLCDKHTIPYTPGKSSIEAMNVELARAAVYDKLVQKEITAKGHLRNDADHGNFGNVKAPDVTDMLRWVRRFAQEHLR